MDNFIGQIILFAGNFDIKSYASCNGQLMSIAQNTALFSILGTTYGGDGRTTFALPDLRGRAPISQGQGPGLSNYTLGQVGGSETTTLITQNMPAHTHALTLSAQVNVSDLNATSDEPAGSFLTTTSNNFYASSGKPGQNLGGVSASGTASIAGNNQPFNNMAPYLVLSYQICLYGIFPSRN